MTTAQHPTDLSAEEFAAMAALALHDPREGPVIVHGPTLLAMVAELRRHRATQLTRGEAHALSWAAGQALARTTAERVIHESLEGALGKLLLIELVGL